MSWPMVSLGDVCVLINGDRGKNYPSKEALFLEGIPFINASNLQDDLSIKCSGANYITDERFELLSNGKVENKDILFCLRGSLGKFGIVGDEIEKGAIASSLVIIRPKDKLNHDYLKNYLRSTLCKREIQNYENGAAQPNLSAKDLKEFKIPLPPLSEQKRIAAILDKADAIRQKRQQAIKLADDFLRSVFLDMFGDPVTNPKGWKVKPLSELIVKGDKINYGIVQPGEHVDGGVPIVRVGDIFQGKIDKFQLKCVSKEIDEKNKNSRLVGDEVLITCVGATVGKIALADSSLKGFNTVRALTRIRLNDQINRHFVFRYLQSPFVQNYFQMQLRTVGQPTLNGKQIGETPILLPEKQLQDAFLDITEQMQLSTNKVIDHVVGADEMFSSLSQKAFSGQL